MLAFLKNLVIRIAFFTLMLVPLASFGNTLPNRSEESVDLVEFLALIQEPLAAIETINKELKDSIEGLTDIFSFENVSEYNKLIHSKGKVEEFLEKLDDCETIYEQAFTLLESLVETTNFKYDSLKIGLQTVFEAGKTTPTKLTREYFSIERSVMQTFDSILDFFIETEGLFHVSNNSELVFSRDSDLERYNLLIKRLREVTQEEEKIIQQLEKLRPL
ncbi:hypothetical protein [Simkania sp.]|uniref:hypothetical protein n=1 Tax=Simkania sp. TaxID=34094 RepID=UPI003B518253